MTSFDVNDDHDHKPVQHRDGKPPWCDFCKLDAKYQQPVSVLDKGSEEEDIRQSEPTTPVMLFGDVRVGNARLQESEDGLSILITVRNKHSGLIRELLKTNMAAISISSNR